MTFFKILHTSKKSKARVGVIQTPHGNITTPNFVAVGTNGTLKALDNVLLDQLGQELIFCNTYHLFLQPGTHVIKQAGGLHSFIKRKGPIITDSGGFQIFSLAYGSVASELKSKGQKQQNKTLLKVTEEGATFRSYIDGKTIFLSPEISVQAQKDLGADIIIPLDELPPYHIKGIDLKKALDRTHRWEQRSLDEHKKDPKGQHMYAVLHGGMDFDLRQHSLDVLKKLDFDGFSIGGSLGKTKKELFSLLEWLVPKIPKEKPNHLLGIGDLESVDFALKHGIDTFDSSYPTRCARHGMLLTKHAPLKITQGKYKLDFGPIEHDCVCPTCTHYSRAYLHHLFKAKELTSYTLATIHNVYFMIHKMKRMQQMILNDEI
ncbi:MAG: Queuine tRNA-ribosyltransferase [Chlamydiae bacterium]|nr:Queuine tRNA-ribosyltransferase [Chlamydiota bacterium]